MSRRRVGFCLSDKKRRQINLVAFAELCASHSVEVVEIDLCQPLESQGPFAVIVHKLSDVIVKAEYDSQSQQLLDNFQGYVSTHPHTVLLDPLPAMSQLLDRFVSYRIMSQLQNSLRDWRISSPPYLEISTSDLSVIQQDVESKGLSFPLSQGSTLNHYGDSADPVTGKLSHKIACCIVSPHTSLFLFLLVCKTRVAHGSCSHDMSLIFSMAGLSEARPPCVLQSFVNHGAVLHKVFVVGEDHFTVERPSLKNFPPGPYERKTIFFNSHEVSKPESCSHLTALDEKVSSLPPPSGEAMVALVRELRAELGMALFGVDVIVSIDTHTLTIIDINIFPGYEGVPQFFSSLLSHIESVLDNQELEEPQATCPPAPSTPQADL
nr:inositol-tetrakisphosphate 1-kinase-like [Oncorhynchus nerka]